MKVVCLWDEEYPVLDMEPWDEKWKTWRGYEIPDELYVEWLTAKIRIREIDEQVTKLVSQQNADRE